jgi:DNA-directed RNA polymerase subunit F
MKLATVTSTQDILDLCPENEEEIYWLYNIVNIVKNETYKEILQTIQGNENEKS